MARVVLVVGVALCALGLIGITLHLLRRGSWRRLRSAAELYRRAVNTLTADLTSAGEGLPEPPGVRSVDLGRQALAAWAEAGTPPTSARLRVKIVTLAAGFAEGLREVGRDADALTHLSAAGAALRERVDAAPARFRPRLAAVLAAMADAEGDLGRTEDALRLDGQAVPLYRDLAEERPAEYGVPLGLALAAEARHFHDIGRLSEALASSAEATTRLRDAGPAALARSGADHAVFLLAAGRDAEALAAAAEAVAAGAQPFSAARLRHADPPASAWRHCVTLTVLARCLLRLGRAPLAEAPLRDAIGLARTTAVGQPARGEAWLADCLTAVAETMTALDRPAEAVAAAQEAETVARRLPAHHEPLLARATWALAAALIAAGRPGDAHTPAGEAVELYKRLTAARPGRFHREQQQAQELLARL